MRVVTTTMLRVVGLFNPVMRELVEMQYLQSDPVILDDSKLALVLGPIRKTSYADGIAQTAAAHLPIITWDICRATVAARGNGGLSWPRL